LFLGGVEVISWIIYVIRNGPQWKDAPRKFGSYKIYNRFIRWSERGVFEKIFTTFVARAGVPECLSIDSAHLKAHQR
jgi:transposase